ncbi:MAG: hypothetical protein LH660_00605 [Phormidesmis sp. CAN_BIN36]|nr:hypothetical protein [Phormidesmis sp. CAN_BIN36]
MRPQVSRAYFYERDSIAPNCSFTAIAPARSARAIANQIFPLSSSLDLLKNRNMIFLLESFAALTLALSLKREYKNSSPSSWGEGLSKASPHFVRRAIYICIQQRYHLLDTFISKLGLSPTAIKSYPNHQNLRSYGVIAV